MNCNEFKDSIMEYIEGDISAQSVEDIEKHMKECNNCCELYFARKAIREEISKEISAENIVFNSQRPNVMKFIDKGRYGKSIRNRIGLHFKRHINVYIASVAVILFAFVCVPYAARGYKEWRATRNINSISEAEMRKIIDADLNEIVYGKTSIRIQASSNPYDQINSKRQYYNEVVSFGKPALNYMLELFSKSKDDGLKEYVMAAACSDILKEDSKTKTWSTGRGWYNAYIGRKQGLMVMTIKNKKGVVEIKDEELINSIIFFIYTREVVHDDKDNIGRNFSNSGIIDRPGASEITFQIAQDGSKRISCNGSIYILPASTYDSIQKYMKGNNNSLTDESDADGNINIEMNKVK